MKFIERFKECAGRGHETLLKNLLNELADDPLTYSIIFNGFGPTKDYTHVCFYYSEDECAFVLIDIDGTQDELVDEEEFCGELPLWFSIDNHRVSPFNRIKTMTDDFLKCLANFGHPLPQNTLTVLCTNTYVINYDDYEEIYTGMNGVVIFGLNTRQLKPRYTTNHNSGEEMIHLFAQNFNINDLNNFHTPFSDNNYDHHNTSDNNVVPPKEIENVDDKDYDQLLESIAEDALDGFFDDNDPDFSTYDEAVNTATGETVKVKRNNDLPPITVYQPLRDPQSHLRQMVGLDGLKTHISEILAYAKFNKRLSSEFPQYGNHPINLHTIITGNPGTGKTTICRIFGSLLHEAGLLSRGHTVIASRGSFIGQNFGSEEQRVRQVLKMAQGGCLFIDEAGQLVNHPHPHDPGREVLQLMLQLLADESNRDIAVVLAFYANDHSLERLYELNPGIKSRFINVLNFPDYSIEDLKEIARRKAQVQGFTFTPTAWKKFKALIQAGFANRGKEYGNAREVINLLQKTLIQHAMRIERHSLSGTQLLRITVADIPAVETAYLATPRIGFK